MAIGINETDIKREPWRLDACVLEDKERMIEGLDALGVVYGWYIYDTPVPGFPSDETKTSLQYASAAYLQVRMTPLSRWCMYVIC